MPSPSGRPAVRGGDRFHVLQSTTGFGRRHRVAPSLDNRNDSDPVAEHAKPFASGLVGSTRFPPRPERSWRLSSNLVQSFPILNEIRRSMQPTPSYGMSCNPSYAIARSPWPILYGFTKCMPTHTMYASPTLPHPQPDPPNLFSSHPPIPFLSDASRRAPLSSGRAQEHSPTISLCSLSAGGDAIWVRMLRPIA